MNSGDYHKYIWQSEDWPHWIFNLPALSPLLSQVHMARGRLLGAIQTLGFQSAEETGLRMLTSETVNSSEIEGEHLDTSAVRSSIARRLGLNVGGLVPSSRQVDGVVEMMVDATRNHAQPLNSERLFGWHAALFSTGYSGMHPITIARYRDDHNGPMQVISGSISHEKVHYEAPPAANLQSEMDIFLTWFNQEQPIDPVIKAGLAHLWFVTLHPFEDGNGRIARAIGDMALARADASAQRFYSLSTQIQRERQAYYTQLEQTQKGTLDITSWLEWFLGALLRAVQNAHHELQGVLYLSRIHQRAPNGRLNMRQMKMLDMLMHRFEGKLTTGKWAKLAGCSTDTALRDIKELIEMGVLLQTGESKRAAQYALIREHANTG